MMESLSVGEIVQAVSGILKNGAGDMVIRGISIDSRKIKHGDAFVALKGESFDGHDFIDKAIHNGTALILTEKKLHASNVPHIIVKDTLRALQDISRYYRNKFQIPFVAVTGSAGKTTTKDMIAAVLSQSFKVHKTEGNYNNAIGLPLTLLELQYTHEVAVLEMGMNSLGEIKLLSDIVRQDVGVISNVGIAHIEKLGSRENILKAKLEIFSNFSTSNTAIINGDNDMLTGYNPGTFRVISFGLGENNDLYAYGIEDKGEEGVDFTVNIDGVPEAFKVLLPGVHNVYNALSAIAVARLFGMGTGDIRKGLLSFKPSKMRMDIIKLDSGIRLVNDVYNANPESMKAAIDVLQSLRSEGRSVCILGDMLELGEYSAEEHYKLGVYAASAGVDLLMALGSYSGEIVRGAIAAGMNAESLYSYSTTEEAAASAGGLLSSGDVVLLKGSRGMRMERIVDLLRERG